MELRFWGISCIECSHPWLVFRRCCASQHESTAFFKVAQANCVLSLQFGWNTRCCRSGHQVRLWPAGSSLSLYSSRGRSVAGNVRQGRVGHKLSIETGMLILLCAACSLDWLSCFPRVFAGSTVNAVFLLFPLVLNGSLNLSISAVKLSERVSREFCQRARESQIAPFVASTIGPILSVEFDPLVKFREQIDVEPLI